MFRVPERPSAMTKVKLNTVQKSGSNHQQACGRTKGIGEMLNSGLCIFQEEQVQKSAFFTVLRYCLLIIFLPIVGFFGTKYVLFDGFLQLTSTQSNIYAAVVAVVSLHLALFLYIYRAYFDTDAKAKATKKD